MIGRLTVALPQPARLYAGRIAWLAAITGSSLMAGRLVDNPAFLRLAFAGVFLLLVVVVGLRAPRGLLVGLVIWLIVLALFRRLLLSASAAGPADPLLLVEPLALVVLTFVAAERGAFRSLTTLSKLVLAYAALVLLSAFNPLQGSVVAGVSALIFFVPLLAFWVGRSLVDDGLLRRVLLTVAVAGVPAALYGLAQTFSGFPSWDRAWMAEKGYGGAQLVGTALRPFSSFSSSAEYGTFIAIGLLMWLALGPRGSLRPVGVAAAALLGVGVFYQSSRGTIVMLLLALGLMLGARRRLPLSGAALVSAALLGLLPFVVTRLAPQSFGTSASSQLVAHQVQGLTNPLDPNSSTAAAHFSLFVDGVQTGFRHPLGFGISTVTIAGSKFGAAVTAGSETDPSNAATALGLPGLLVYLGLLGVGLTSAYRLASRTHDRLALAALGVLSVMVLQWLNGGQYAVAFLPWLILGWVDARTASLKRS
jgi:hypothetical protein